MSAVMWRDDLDESGRRILACFADTSAAASLLVGTAVGAVSALTCRALFRRLCYHVRVSADMRVRANVIGIVSAAVAGVTGATAATASSSFVYASADGTANARSVLSTPQPRRRQPSRYLQSAGVALTALFSRFSAIAPGDVCSRGPFSKRSIALRLRAARTPIK